MRSGYSDSTYHLRRSRGSGCTSTDGQRPRKGEVSETTTADDMARIAARAIDAKRGGATARADYGRDTIVLDVSETLGICDYFVIGSGANTRQVKALVDNVEERLLQAGLRPRGREGRQDAYWTLLDYGDVIVHIFLDEARDFYQLEKLWSDSPRRQWQADSDVAASR